MKNNIACFTRLHFKIREIFVFSSFLQFIFCSWWCRNLRLRYYYKPAGELTAYLFNNVKLLILFLYLAFTRTFDWILYGCHRFYDLPNVAITLSLARRKQIARFRQRCKGVGASGNTGSPQYPFAHHEILNTVKMVYVHRVCKCTWHRRETRANTFIYVLKFYYRVHRELQFKYSSTFSKKKREVSVNLKKNFFLIFASYLFYDCVKF